MKRTLWGCRPRLSPFAACVVAAGAATLLTPAFAGSAYAADTSGGRNWEVVTPADRDYGVGNYAGEWVVASHDGNAVAFDTVGPLPGSQSGAGQNLNVSRRGDKGWATKPISPPVDTAAGASSYPVFFGFAPDLTKSVFLAKDPLLTSDAVAGSAELYAGDTNTGAYELLTKSDSPDATKADFSSAGGSSEDGRHILFQTHYPLSPDDQAPGSYGVYEYVDGAARYVAILPDGTPAELSTIWTGRQRNLISRDGRRIVFAGGAATGTLELYVRIDGTTTRLVSGSQRTVPDPNSFQASPPQFWGATADGNKVYFTTSRPLTDDATTGDDGSGGFSHGGQDLYEYNVDTGKLTDLSVDTNPADAASGANVLGVPGISEDGHYVYFVATGDLGGGATSGMPNLYVRHDGHVRFIGTLDWGDGNVWTASPAGEGFSYTSRVSADGRTLAFPSVAPLTGYDNTDPDTATPYSQVFRYDAAAGKLACASCHAGGTRPRGASTIGSIDFPTNPPRYLSEDGRRLFFDSADALVLQDTNGRTDVYEYAGGALHLVSSGSSRFDAKFEDASASGDDAFFVTRGQLAAGDRDDLTDLYDARIGGGFPLTRNDGCTAQTCGGGTSAPAPPSDVPGSATLDGPGNAVAKRVVKPAFSFRSLTKAQRRNAARTGRLTLSVSVNQGGTIKAKLRGKVGKRTQTVGGATRKAAKSGTIRLSLRLNAAARRALSRHRTLTLRLTITYSKVSTAKRATVSLHR